MFIKPQALAVQTQRVTGLQAVQPRGYNFSNPLEVQRWGREGCEPPPSNSLGSTGPRIAHRIAKKVYGMHWQHWEEERHRKGRLL